MTLGDLWAGVAALRGGKRRFVSPCEKFGEGMVLAAMQSLLDNGEEMTRIVLAKLPEEAYEATGTAGGYGDSLGRPRSRVMDDLKNGYIMPEQAREHYSFRTE